jgi:hypothetical protein
MASLELLEADPRVQYIWARASALLNVDTQLLTSLLRQNNAVACQILAEFLAGNSENQLWQCQQ